MASMALETREGDQELIAKILAASEQDEDDDQALKKSGGGADAQMEKDMEYPTKKTLVAGFECAWCIEIILSGLMNIGDIRV